MSMPNKRPCACGCGTPIPCYDKRKRPRLIVHGHTNKGKTYENNPNWKGGRIIDRKGYVLVRCLGHPNAVNGYMREHVLVMEKAIGRILIPNVDDVHHINGDKQDNRIENLQLMTHSEHTILTNAKKKT